MKIKSFVAAAVIALSGVSSFAATYNLGPLSAGDTFLSGSSTAVISVAKGSFADTFNFSLAGPSDVLPSIGALSLRNFKISDATFSYSLFSGSTLLGSGDSNSELSFSALTTGAYSLVINGDATGSLGGRYNGSLSVTPVPEPESIAMLLAGLGLMGTIARRRNKATSAA